MIRLKDLINIVCDRVVAICEDGWDDEVMIIQNADDMDSVSLSSMLSEEYLNARVIGIRNYGDISGRVLKVRVEINADH